MTGYSMDEIRYRGHPVWAEVDLDAIRHNIAELRRSAPSAEVMGVVKGYAYGHGNPASARAMLQGGATRLGVARVAEALHLRESGIDAPIHVFTEPPTEAVDLLITNDLTATIYTEAFASALSSRAAELGRVVPVHLKLDTGMHRVGLMAGDVADAMANLRALRGIEIEGVWSHLAVADIDDHPFTRKQLDLFAELLERIERAGINPRYRHIANSAAALTISQSHYDIVRCGVASYGLTPGAGLSFAAQLRPALALRARVTMVKHVAAGERLSYGLRYQLRESGNVVTVPAGYADGYDRRLSDNAEVLLHGKRHHVSGTVCMDQFMVDVGADAADVGDVVTLIGRDGDDAITAEELAANLGTINYEITSRIPSRVPRVYIGEQQ